MRMLAAVVLAALSIPPLAAAQVHDTLIVGDRVRIRVGEARGYTNVFIGRLAAISHDTVILEIPHDKGTMIFARSAISEIAVPNGRESRWGNVAMVAPLFALPIAFATTTLTSSAPHSKGYRARQIVLSAALLATPIAAVFRHRPAERWDPLYRWLDAR
jgi:hypothetical protein